VKYLNRETGRIGEEAAGKFLEDKGLCVVLKNFRTKLGEIDLICKDKDVLVFVEVKTKKGGDFGTPEEMFTRGKYNKVRRMATLYLKGEEINCRIDMVAVDLEENNLVREIRHYANVVYTTNR